MQFWNNFPWMIAWRHLRGESHAPTWVRLLFLLAAYLVAVGLGLIGYAELQLAPDFAPGLEPPPGSGFSLDVTTPSQRHFATFGGITFVVGCFLAIYAAYARRFNTLTTLVIYAVTLGSMAQVVVLSLMNGLEVQLADSLRSQNADLSISHKEGKRFAEYQSILEDLQQGEAATSIQGASPVLVSEILLRSGLQRHAAILNGIDLERHKISSDLENSITHGNLDSLVDPAKVEESSSLSNAAIPWRLRTLDQEKPASEQGKNAAPVPTPEHLKVGTDQKTETKDQEQESDSSPGPSPEDSALSKKFPLPSGNLSEFVPKVAEPPPIDWKRFGGKQKHTSDQKPDKSDEEEDQDEEWEDPLEELDLKLDAGQNSDNQDSKSGPPGDQNSIVDDERPEEGESPSKSSKKSAMPDALIIGQELALELAIHTGANVQLITPVGRLTPSGRLPGRLAARIGAIFKSGYYPFDSRYAYISLPVAQAFLHAGDRVSKIEVKLHPHLKDHPEQAKAEIQTVLDKLGRDDLQVATWKELNSSLFAAMFLEKLAMWIGLLSVVLVASFGVLSSNLVSVAARARSIAILKSMGSPDRLVASIFSKQAMCIGIVGASMGTLVGLALSWALGSYGVPFVDQLFYAEQLPMSIQPPDVLLVYFSTIGLVWIFGLYPAIVAARMRPVDTMRSRT